MQSGKHEPRNPAVISLVYESGSDVTGGISQAVTVWLASVSSRACTNALRSTHVGGPQAGVYSERDRAPGP